MIFGERCFWRDTTHYPQVMIVDARIIFFMGLAVFNLSLLTFFLLLVSFLLFVVLSWKSIRLESALRMVRFLVLGLERPATTRPLRMPAHYLQHGPDGRWCPLRLTNLTSKGRGNGVLALVLAIGLGFVPEAGYSWMYWQGLAPYYQPEKEDSFILLRPGSQATPFHSPAPRNPDWHQNCLMPGIDQPWCLPGLFKSPEYLGPLDLDDYQPKSEEVVWPVGDSRNAEPIKRPSSDCVWIVSPGDTLSFIAGKVYGDMELWPQLAAANAIEDPWHIYPDQCIIDLK